MTHTENRGRSSQYLRGLSLELFVLFLIFLSIFAIHASRHVLTSYDSGWTIPLAVSMLTEGNTDLNEYAAHIDPNDYRVEREGGSLYSYFPIGTPLLALPFVWATQQIAPHQFEGEDIYSYTHKAPNGVYIAKLEEFIASFFVALTSLVLYRIARLYVNGWRALLIVFIFGLCTSSLSTASRALWQHTLTVFLITLVLYLLLLSEKNPHFVQYSALPLAMLYLIRPTNSVSIILLTLWVLIRYRVYFIRYCLWALLIAIPFLLYNFSIYGALLSPYYQPNRIVSSPFFRQALAGNLISPGRGLFIWTPILLFSFYGIYRWRTKALTLPLVGILLLHWITISSYPHWYGGWSIGPRLFTDMLPYWVYFLIPVIQELPEFSTVGQLVKTLLFFLALLFSFAVHFHSGSDVAVVLWNAEPVDVDVDPSRIWDWKDLQFLRGFRLGFPQPTAHS